MTEESCYQKPVLFNARIRALNAEMYPGELPDNTGFNAWTALHRRLIDEGKTLLGCDCRHCEQNRGRVGEERERIRRIHDARRTALWEEYENGPPMADDPSLWEEWPATEET